MCVSTEMKYLNGKYFLLRNYQLPELRIQITSGQVLLRRWMLLLVLHILLK